MRIVDDETLLFDFLEKELEPELRFDFEQVSEQDRKVKQSLTEIQQIRRLIKEQANTSLLPQEDFYFENLHAQIMARVEKTKPVRRTPFPGKWETSSLRIAASFVFLVVGFGGLIFSSMRLWNAPQAVVKVVDPDHLLIETSATDTKLVAETIVSSTSDDDLILDATALKLGELSDSDAKIVISALLE